MSKLVLAVSLSSALAAVGVLSSGCSSSDPAGPHGTGGGGTGVGGAGGSGDTSTSSTGLPPDTIVCAPGTYEFPLRSGVCIDDPCDPDPCGGTGTCSNVTGVSVCTACTHFVDATAGLDANDGASPATAWQSIAKVDATTLVAGDNVCFKRGETFFGGLTVGQSGAPGNPIRFGNYGESTKPKPVVSGFSSLTDWMPGAPGIWKSACPACGDTVNMVARDGALEPMGRTPNRSAPNGGYATYESVIGPASANAEGYYGSPYAGALAIVDDQLSATPDWTGAEVVVRKTNYVLDRSLVTSHVGTKIQYQNPMKPAGSIGRPGWGYFFQNSLQTLDEVGEWYYDPAKHEMNVFFGAAGPATTTIEASSVDKLVAIGSQSDIAFDGIVFRGSNGVAIDLNQSKNVSLTSVEARLSGQEAVWMSKTDGVTIRNSVIDSSNDNAIVIVQTSTNSVVTENIIQSSGMIPGAGARLAEQDVGNYSGILVGGGTVDQNTVIEGNVVDKSGYNGVHFVASGVTVKNNLVTNFTQILDDGGGIYTWRGSEVYVNRKITGNIVVDGPGSADGKPDPTDVSSSCIYLDNATSNLEVSGNTMARCSRAALLENYAHDVTITGNTAFDSRTQAEIWSLSNAPIVANACSENVFFSKKEAQPVMIVSAVGGQIQSFGPFDHNYYVRPTENDLIIDATVDSTKFRSHSLAAWQLAFGLDANSSKTPVVLKPHGVPTLVGGDLVTGGDFESGIGNVVVWSSGNNGSGAANSASKVIGAGSLQLSFATPVRSDTLIYTGSPGIGAVSSAKTYLLKVSTLGTSVNGIISATIRQTKSPYANLSPAQKRSFGTTRIDHEFVITAPTDDPSATFVIGIDERSGMTWVDGIEVYEVTAPVVNPEDSIRFEFNSRTTPKTIMLDGKYIDAKSTPYDGSITLAPFTSAVLMKPPPS